MQVDDELMRRVVTLAERALSSGNNPFAALLYDHQIISEDFDRALERNDPTQHAEIIVLSQYCQNAQKPNLDGYTLYTLVEPCPMCAGAIHYTGITRLVYAVSRDEFQTIRNTYKEPVRRRYTNCRDIIVDGKHSAEIVSGICRTEALQFFENCVLKSKVF